ncbi:MAG: hypothetical protein IPG22_02590 [Acidobacteria bacterium]|nr:hypothetical protein [Acidobacteriota bacterium]
MYWRRGPSFALGPVIRAEGNGAAGTSAPFYVRLTRTGTTQVPTVITYSTSTSGGTATGAHLVQLELTSSTFRMRR